MKYLVIEALCQSCSFRNPDFQNFHKSYDLPPPTTIIGMAGAALGLSPKKSQKYFDENFEIGVGGTYKGKSLDLWKYRDRDSEKRSILTREVLFENVYFLVFGHNSEDKLNELRNAFKNPVYALTLGNSDGLSKIKQTQIINETITCNKIENCIAEGNLLKEVLDNSEDKEFSLKDGTDPVSFEVPVSFEYESEYGIRRVNKRKEITFIGPAMYVKGLKRKGIEFKNQQIPLFKLYD